MNQFHLPIGDWANDGHGRCKYYVVESNKPLAEVNEAWRKSAKAYSDTKPDKYWRRGSEYKIPLNDWKAIVAAGFVPCYDADRQRRGTLDQELDDNGRSLEHEEYVDLILWFIMRSNSDLVLKRIEDLPLFTESVFGLGWFDEG